MIEFTEIATVIQLAVAPAFLLTGIGAILAVMSTRLSRIVDRYRILKEGSKKLNKEHKKEIEFLIKRSKWTHWAIALTTVSALLICVLIPMIFIATEVLFNFDQLITILFILAMAFLIFGLLSFLKEVDLSKGVINV
jgi:fatty acid desaturase